MNYLFIVLLLLCALLQFDAYSMQHRVTSIRANSIVHQKGYNNLYRNSEMTSAASSSTSLCMAKRGGGRDRGPRPKKAPKDDVIVVSGKVVESLPNAMFRVEIEPTSQIILATISGKIRKNFVRIVVGDSVTVELSAYDLSRGRITYRAKN